MGNQQIKLAIDVGNSNIVIGRCQGKQLLDSQRQKTADFSPVGFTTWLKELKGDKDIDVIGLSCVVPRFYQEIVGCTKEFGRVLDIKIQNFPWLVVKADNREEMGADFICAYYGVLAKYDAPAVVFDMGSAIKAMVIDENKEIIGVAIKPGIRQTLNAMVKNIPHLPNIDLAIPDYIIGNNTLQAINAGVYYGELSNLQYYSQLLDEHYGFNSTKILTGGYSRFFWERLPQYHYEPDLLLTGINEIIDNFREDLL